MGIFPRSESLLYVLTMGTLVSLSSTGAPCPQRLMVKTMANDEDAICDLLDAFTRALYNKDAAGAIAPFADDVVAFDLAPPLQLGPDVMRDAAHLEEWFATWNGPIVSEPAERTIVVDGDVAYAYGLQRMTGTKTDGEEVDFGSVPPPAFAAMTVAGGLPTCIILCPSRWTVAKKRCSI